MKKDEIPLFPVASTTVGPIPRLELITIRLDYLTGPMQDPTKPNPGIQYALTPAQATDLVQQIIDSLDQLKNTEFQAQPGQRH